MLFCPQIFGVPEFSLPETMPAIRAHFETGSGGTFQSFDGRQVGYWRMPGEGTPIVISVGLGESYGLYQETVWDLRVLRRPIIVLELRGQAHGDRLSSVSRQIYHVRSFEDYARDFAFFVDHHMGADESMDVIAHSTGAYGAIKFTADRPQRVRRLILISPLIEPELGSLPSWLAQLIARGLCLVGRCQNYVPFRGDRTIDDIRFDGNRLTHSEIRFQRIVDVLKDNPSLLSGGPSNNWILEALRTSDELMRTATTVRQDVLQLSSDRDGYSTVASQTQFCARIHSCSRVDVEGSRHAMLLEVDRIRDQVISLIIQELENSPSAR
jgi:lysophospholipase